MSGEHREEERERTLMRKKSWLRQASRDRRPRRTQSSMSPSYSGNTAVPMEGRETQERQRDTDDRTEIREKSPGSGGRGRKRKKEGVKPINPFKTAQKQSADISLY